VIGINQYPGGSHNLEAAVNDANDMTSALGVLGVPGDHILRLTDTQATAGVIEQSANWLVAHAAPDAIATFFFAGHVRKLSSSTEALVGSDGNVVTDADLAGRFADLAARRAWFVIAGCYGGGFNELLAPGRILTAAADANHLAYENESLGRSYLDEFLVHQAIIEGKAPATVQSAFNYAYSAIAQQYPGQQPVEYEDQVGPLNLRPPGSAALASFTASPPTTSDGSAGPPGSNPPPTGAPPPNRPPNAPPSTAPPTTSTTEDGCAQLTVGVVRCNP
jgi:hypothetical protein